MVGRPHDGAWPARGYGLALTVVLHLLIVAALLYRTHTARIERPTAEPSVITLKLLSAAPQTASIAAIPAPTPPRARRAKPPAPHPSPVTVQPVAPETPAANASAPPAAVTQLAAAPPADAEPDVPPPLEYLRRISRMTMRSERKAVFIGQHVELPEELDGLHEVMSSRAEPSQRPRLRDGRWVS